MQNNLKQKTKQTISWVIGIPAGLIVVGEQEGLEYWYLPFVALGIIIFLIWWNKGFDYQQNNFNQKGNMRKIAVKKNRTHRKRINVEVIPPAWMKFIET